MCPVPSRHRCTSRNCRGSKCHLSFLALTMGSIPRESSNSLASAALRLDKPRFMAWKHPKAMRVSFWQRPKERRAITPACAKKLPLTGTRRAGDRSKSLFAPMDIMLLRRGIACAGAGECGCHRASPLDFSCSRLTRCAICSLVCTMWAKAASRSSRLG